MTESFNAIATRITEEYIQFDKLIESLKQADDAARMIGFYREDPRWIQVAGLIAAMRDKTIVMARKN